MRIFTNKIGHISIPKVCSYIAGAAAILITFLNSITRVPIGYVGVETTMSEVTGDTYPSGWYFKIPFATSIEDMSVQRQVVELPKTQGELSGKEIVNLVMKMTYALSATAAPSVYENYGTDYINTLMPIDEIFDVVKAIIADYNIDNFASKREEIMTKAMENLNKRFSDRGVIITSLALSNYSFDEKLEQAIAEANNAAQLQKTQEITNKTELDKAKNDKLVAEEKAQAEANAKIKAAEAEAEAIKIKAEAEAEANKEIAASINDKVLEYEKTKNWNGELPKVMSGGESNFIVDTTK